MALVLVHLRLLLHLFTKKIINTYWIISTPPLNVILLLALSINSTFHFLLLLPLCPSNSLRYHICNPLSGALSVPPFTLGREVGIIGSLLLVALISDHFVVGRRIHHGGILRHWHSPSASRLRHAHWIRGVRRVRRIRLRWSVRVVLTRHRHSMLLMLWHGIWSWHGRGRHICIVMLHSDWVRTGIRCVMLGNDHNRSYKRR